MGLRTHLLREKVSPDNTWSGISGRHDAKMMGWFHDVEETSSMLGGTMDNRDAEQQSAAIAELVGQRELLSSSHCGKNIGNGLYATPCAEVKSRSQILHNLGFSPNQKYSLRASSGFVYLWNRRVVALSDESLEALVDPPAKVRHVFRFTDGHSFNSWCIESVRLPGHFLHCDSSGELHVQLKQDSDKIHPSCETSFIISKVADSGLFTIQADPEQSNNPLQAMSWLLADNTTERIASPGKQKPLAPCCCKCTAEKRINCQYECMAYRKQEFESMFEGHKHERAHWVWCGFACLACEYKSVPELPSCAEDEVTSRDLNKVPLEGDDKTLPAWWMGIMRNTVISSQKVQGITPDAEPCDLGVVDEKTMSDGGMGGELAGRSGSSAANTDQEDPTCGFMCKMKKSMSKTKQGATNPELDDKGVQVTRDAIERQANDEKNEEQVRAQTAAAARLSEKDTQSSAGFAKTKM